MTGLAAILGVAVAEAQDAAYQLQTGDRLRLGVAGAPEFEAEAMIGVDGLVRFPRVGAIAAAGATLGAVESAARARLASAMFRRFSEDGAPILIGVGPDDIYLDVAAFSPVYVGGDVASPGEIAFRPGLTVRAVVAVAGGVGRMARGNAGGGYGLSPEAGLIAALRVARATARELRAENWLLEALLAEGPSTGSAASDAAPASPAPAGSASGDAVGALAALRLAEATTALANQRAFLESVIVQAVARAEALEKQAVNERAGLGVDDEEYARVQELFARGVVAATRLSDVRRSQLASSTRVLQTESALTAANFARAEAQRARVAFEETRREELLAALAKNRAGLTAAAARLAEAEAELAALGLSDDAGATPARITIHRRQGSRTTTLATDMDAVLQPGDLVEIDAPGLSGLIE